MCRAPAAGGCWSRAGALFVATLLAVGLPAQEFPVRIARGRFTVVADARDSLLATSLASYAAGTDTFPGLPRPRDSVLVQIAPDERIFRQLIGAGAPEWGAAFAFPLERRVVMQGRSAPSSAGDPLRVLRHELGHLVLFEHLGDLPPRWFDEGYASWVAGEWNREDVIAANLGLALGGFRSLAALDSGFEVGARRADASYALSYRAVAELASVDPQRGLDLFFTYWREERSFDRALRRAFALTEARFEQRWLARTRRRYGALALFADVTLGAVVLVLIVTPLYLVRRRRDRERLARMREADAIAERREQESAIEALLRSVDDSSRGGPAAGGASS
ncbi:MAG: peptidase MA family metallohydrolase [Gemmatimonadaceae bacterium]